jgi:hypothetical protein
VRKEEKLTELKVHMATLEHDGEFWAAVSPDANVEKIGSPVHKIVQKRKNSQLVIVCNPCQNAYL